MDFDEKCTSCLGVGKSCVFDVAAQTCCKQRNGLFSSQTTCASALLLGTNTTVPALNKELCIGSRRYAEVGDIVEAAEAAIGSDDAEEQEDVIKCREAAPSFPVESHAHCISMMLRQAILDDLREDMWYNSQRPLRATCPPKVAPEARENTLLGCCLVRSLQETRQHEEPCEIVLDGADLPGDLDFGAIRRTANARRQLVKSMKAGPLRSTSFSAGKSGSKFFSSSDGAFFLKTVKVEGVGSVDERATLLKLMWGDDGRTPLATHLKATNSMINPILGMYTVKVLGTTDTYIIMPDASLGLRNRKKSDVSALPVQSEEEAEGKHDETHRRRGVGFFGKTKFKPYYEKQQEKDEHLKQGSCEVRKYDLKGSSRKKKVDEAARFNRSVQENVEFRLSEGNQFGLSWDDCRNFRASVIKDSVFLDQYKLIDYSILASFGGSSDSGCDNSLCSSKLAARGISRNEYPTKGCFMTTTGHGRAPSGELVALGLIDYLNEFNFIKKLENTYSSGKFENYSIKIDEFVKQACPFE